ARSSICIVATRRTPSDSVRSARSERRPSYHDEMKTPKPERPCPWCGGSEFLLVEAVQLEVTDYGRRVDCIPHTERGHPSFSTQTPRSELTGKIVRVAPQAPYR